MKNKTIFSLSIVVSFLIGVSSGWSANYVLGYSSVDYSGGMKEIRWEGTSVYMTYFHDAARLWNDRKKVNIAPDILSTIEDLTIKDVSVSGVTWAGRVTNRVGADLFEFNKVTMDQLTRTGQKQRVANHELGHALGLAHSPGSSNVMYESVPLYPSVFLGSQDVTDYVYLYGN